MRLSKCEKAHLVTVPLQLLHALLDAIEFITQFSFPRLLILSTCAKLLQVIVGLAETLHFVLELLNARVGLFRE